MKTYECLINLPQVNPSRQAYSEEKFIENLISEYNNTCRELFEINRSDISKIICYEDES